MTAYIRTYNYQLPDTFEETYISTQRDIKGVFGRLSILPTSPFYPEKSEAKIMRKDVIASIIVLGKMFESLNFPPKTLEDISLFVANGAFLEEENKHMKRMMKAFHKIIKIEAKTQKLKYVYKSVPPLTALETLTNSTMSFIAKYSQTKGNNTTFGNTSYGGFSALTKGIDDILNGKNYALVGGANGSGVYSALAHLNFYKKNKTWKESANTAFVLLQNKKENAIAKIVEYKQGEQIPSLSGKNQNRNWNFFFDKKPEMVIYSGGFTPDEFEKNKTEINAICSNHFSWNEEYGNLGAASIMMSLIKAATFIENKKYKTVDIVDRDPFGREVYLKIM